MLGLQGCICGLSIGTSYLAIEGLCGNIFGNSLRLLQRQTLSALPYVTSVVESGFIGRSQFRRPSTRSQLAMNPREVLASFLRHPQKLESAGNG